LIALAVSALESLVRACERELQVLDMSINVKNLIVSELVFVIMILVLILRPVMAIPYSECLSLDIWVYSLFRRDRSNVLLCMLNVFTRDSVAIARICYGNSVCLSVRPSVCHTGGSVKNG